MFLWYSSQTVSHSLSHKLKWSLLIAMQTHPLGLGTCISFTGSVEKKCVIWKQVFCSFSLMVISPHGAPPVSVWIQTQTSTTKGTRLRRQLAIIYWQLMWYWLLIFGVLLEYDPSGSWKAAFDTQDVYGRHLACCHSRELSLTFLTMTLCHVSKCCC